MVFQVRECATALLHIAKKHDIPIFLVGHVTKSGDIAGPKVLEHIVDVVLYMEGEKHQSFRWDAIKLFSTKVSVLSQVNLVVSSPICARPPPPNPPRLFPCLHSVLILTSTASALQTHQGDKE